VTPEDILIRATPILCLPEDPSHSGTPPSNSSPSGTIQVEDTKILPTVCLWAELTRNGKLPSGCRSFQHKRLPYKTLTDRKVVSGFNSGTAMVK
jgi:hypothetical protein